MTKAERAELNRSLLEWYDANGRDLPWRQTDDPYAIWVSEIMLQQTTVAAVLPYYERWLAELPTLEALANVSEESAMRLWQGLGYYGRLRNLQAGAKAVLAHGWPKSESEWREVPGVGDYTAAALASRCLGEASAVVDGNVVRVYARQTADPCASSRRLRDARTWAQDLIDLERPADWNQAIMELGATLCRPRNPDCERCPVQASCHALRIGQVEAYPAKKPKPEWIERREDVLIPWVKGKFGTQMAEAGGWWQGLWVFPTRQADTIHDGASWAAESATRLGSIRHTVTRHRLIGSIWLITTWDGSCELTWRTAGEMERTPLPSHHAKAFKLACRHLDAPNPVQTLV
jgi:A/G-specific adenine glycosylase